MAQPIDTPSTNIPFVETYSQRNKYRNPVEEEKKSPDFKVKDEVMFKKKAEWMFSNYLQNQAYIPFSQVNNFREFRLYGQGKQPTGKYRELLTIKDRKTGTPKNWMNMSWDNVPIFPKMRDIIKGKFSEIDWNTTITGLDDQSHSEREDAKLEVWVRQQESEYYEYADKVLGIKDPQKPLPFQPKSLEDLDMLASLGCFKTAYEITMKKLTLISEKFSDWESVKDDLTDDAIDLGLIATKDYTDPVTGKPMVRYVDPEYLIITTMQRQKALDYIPEAGEVVFYTIKELEATGLLNEKQLLKAATAYQGQLGNPTYQRLGLNNTYNVTYSMYNQFKVAVLDVEFESFDTSVAEIVQRADGNMKAFPVPFDTVKPSSGKGRKIERKTYPKRYRCKWVIGTDVVYDYGHQFNVVYDEYERPKSSFNIYKISDRSITSRCVSSIDDLQIAFLRLRNAIAKAPPAGVFIDWSALTEIAQDGGGKLSGWDLLKIRTDTGDLPYRPKMAANGMPVQGGVPPIIESKGGVGILLDELMKTIDFNLNILREITGISQVVDASQPQPGQLVGTSKIAEAATNFSLKPLLVAISHVKKQTFKGICKRWQLLALTDGVSEYFTPYTGAGVELIGLDKNAYNFYFDLDVQEMFDADMKQNILGAAQQSLMAAKTGAIGITMSDYFKIIEFLNLGEIQAAYTFLSFKEQQQRDQQQQLQAQNMAQNQQGAMQTQQAQAQQEAAMAQMALQNQLTLIKAQGNEDRLTEALRSKNKVNEIVIGNQTKPVENKEAPAEETGEAKPPSTSITFKDLPSDGKQQLAAQAGITLEASDFDEKVAEDNKSEVDKATAIAKAKPKPSPAKAS